MADVFISYSRKDQDFVRRLNAGLERLNRECWVDWESIPLTAEWRREIYSGIEGTNTCVVVISPDSIKSVVCQEEIGHAASHNKRLIPVVCRDVDAADVPPALAVLNWIFFRETDDFDASLEALLAAIDTDLEWVAMHTRLLTRAIEWEKKNRDDSLLLRGNDLRSAEQWLAAAGKGKGRNPTSLQTEYLLAARKATTRRQRWMLAAASGALLITIVLALVALFQKKQADARRAEAERQKRVAEQQTRIAQEQRTEAERQRQIALARQLAAQSELIRTQQPRLVDKSVLLALESLRRMPSLEADQALRKAVEHLPRPRTIIHGETHVRQLEFSPDARLLATVWEDGRLTVSDPVTGELHHEFEHPGRVSSITFSRDGQKLATSGNSEAADQGYSAKHLPQGSVQVWDVATGKQLRAIEIEHAADQLVFSPDGLYLALGSNNKVEIRDAVSGNVVGSFTLADRVDGLTFSTDGRTLCAVGLSESAVCDSPRASKVERHANSGGKISCNSSGTCAIARSNETAGQEIFDVPANRRLVQLAKDEFLSALAFSAEGKSLATGATNNVVRVWRVPEGEEIARLGVPGTASVQAVALSSDGSLVAAADHNLEQVVIWSLGNGSEIRATEGGELRGACNVLAGGRYLARPQPGQENATAVAIIDADNGSAIAELKTAGLMPQAATLDGNRYASVATRQAGPVVWNRDGSEVRLVSRETPWDPIDSRIALGGNGRLLAVSAAYWGDRSRAPNPEMNWLRLWDVGAQREIANVPSVVCSDIQFSPDGALLAVATRNQVVFFDLAAGKQGLTLTCNSQVNSVAFDHTGHRLAIGESGGVVRVVDLTTGTTALTFNHDDAVLGVAFSPDGKFLATGSRDHSARLWDLQSGKEISRILHRGSLSTVGFSASGKFLISATTNFTQRSFWRPEDLITDACGRVAHNMSAEDWRQFLGDEPIRKTCVDLP